MTVTTNTSARRVGTHGRARLRVPHVPARAVPSVAANAATVSAQRGGGPSDFALYGCSCGASFDAPVSACVDCPACGGAQDW